MRPGFTLPSNTNLIHHSMKRLSFLKSIVTLVFAGAMIFVFFGLPLILIMALYPTSVPFNFNGHLLDAGHTEIVLLALVMYAGHCAFTYGLYQFKQTLTLFSKRVFFDVRIVQSLDQTGKSFIVAGMLWVIPPFFYRLLAQQTLEIGIDVSGFGSTLFGLSLGLFFIVLSEVFFNAKLLKEETDLTV